MSGFRVMMFGQEVRGQLKDRGWSKNMKPMQPGGWDDWVIPRIVEADVSPGEAVVFSCATLYIVSRVVADVLVQNCRNSDDFRFHPVNVLGDEGDDAFFCLDLFRVVDAVDRVKSDHDEDDGRIDEIRSLVLDESKIDDGVDVFWLDAWEDVLCIRGEVAKALELLGVRNLSLVHPSDF